MAKYIEIRVGDVYWCEEYPDLGGGPPKARYCVVFLIPTALAQTQQVFTVAISSSTTAFDRVHMPNREQNLGCATGLPRVCWAVPEWIAIRTADELTDRVGHLTRVKVDEIGRAIKARRDKQRKSTGGASTSSPSS